MLNIDPDIYLFFNIDYLLSFRTDKSSSSAVNIAIWKSIRPDETNKGACDNGIASFIFCVFVMLMVLLP